MSPRVSPDGKLLAFEREDALWVLGLDPNAERTGEIVAQIQKRGQVFALERRIVGLGGSSLGSPPVWSPDGKQIVISTVGPRVTVPLVPKLPLGNASREAPASHILASCPNRLTHPFPSFPSSCLGTHRVKLPLRI
jgi:hypothetical protein